MTFLSIILTALLNLPLVAQPGEKFIYSVSIDVLGRLIEMVSNESRWTWCATRLGSRAARNDSTYFLVPEEKYTLADVSSEARDLPNTWKIYKRYQP